MWRSPRPEIGDATGEMMFRFDATFRNEFRDNWLVLVIVFVCFLFGFAGPAYAMPFIFPEVIDEFGWTREEATLLASFKYAVGAAAAISVGRVVDWTGAWAALIFTVSTAALGLLSFLWIDNLTQYYLTGLLMGFSSGGTMVALKVLISRSFHASQGTAMGLAMLGTVMGSIVLPFIITATIAVWGWRGGIASISAGIWIVVLPLLFYGLFSKRLDFGHRVKKKTPKEIQAEQASSDGPVSEVLTVRQIFSQRRFWLIGISVMMVAGVDMAFTQHQVLIFNDVGMSPEWVAIAISSLGVAGILTRLVVGNILDSSSNKGLAFCWTLLSVSCLLAFGLLNPIIVIAFIAFRALGHSAVMLDTTVMTKHVYGPAQLGTMLGLYTAMVSIGFAIGPWLMGRLYDMSGSYASSFILSIILPLFAALLIWQVKPVFWLKMKQKAAERAIDVPIAQPEPGAPAPHR